MGDSSKTLKILFLLLFLYLFASCSYQGAEINDSIPAWFEEGVYARYKFSGVEEVIFINKTYYRFQPVNVFFKWEVVKFDGHRARLETSFIFEHETTLVSSSKGSLKLNLTTYVYVDVESRDLWVNNNVVGKTCFWLSPYPEKGDKYILFGNPQRYLNGTVGDIGALVETPQGYQPVFDVDVAFEGVMLWFAYDLTTGLLIHGRQIGGIEAMFLALRISEVDRFFHLDDTNIDLGPPSLRPLIVKTLSIIAPGFVLIIVISTLYKRRKRKLFSRFL
ncbi:hypothetical protein J7L60_06910 [Candidatus Bathyarchaeota archaeon]|nr:hypothetical protein [Candidatus Bathyarchaeota archaeon]